MGKIAIKFSISYPLLTQRISRWMTFYTQVMPEQLWSTFSIRFASHTSITDSNYQEEMKKKMDAIKFESTCVNVVDVVADFESVTTVYHFRKYSYKQDLFFSMRRTVCRSQSC